MMEPIAAFKTSLLVPTSTSVPALPIADYEQAGEAGQKALWVVFFIMLLSSLSFFYMAYRTPVQKRLFHVITALITTFATISYFAMATGSGISFAHIIVKHVHKHEPDVIEHVYREVYWARYIDWAVTTPLLLLDLSFLAGLNGANILVAIAADVIMVLLGLFAAFGNSESQKWGWYAMSCASYLVIVYQLVVPARSAVSSKDNKTATLFASIGGFTLILWTLYPIVWAIGDGARQWGVDSEIIAYAILDVLAKPIFGFWLLFAHSQHAAPLDGFWAHGLTGEGSIRIDDDEGA